MRVNSGDNPNDVHQRIVGPFRSELLLGEGEVQSAVEIESSATESDRKLQESKMSLSILNSPKCFDFLPQRHQRPQPTTPKEQTKVGQSAQRNELHGVMS